MIKRALTVSTLICISAAVSAVADYIPLVDGSGTSAGWAVVIAEGSAVNVNVEQVSGDEVIINIEKTFVGDVDQYNLFTPIVLQFEKTSELAFSQITISYETVTNNTARIWSDYHVALMVDIFNPEAGFAKGSIGGDQLESVEYVNKNGYLNLPIQIDFYNTEGAGVSNVPGQNLFQPGLQSGSMEIQTDVFAMEIGDRFGLKQWPTITPEPATVIIFAMGAVSAISKRRNKRVAN